MFLLDAAIFAIRESRDGCSWNSFCSCSVFAASGELILTLMASQPVGGREDITSLEVQSYIRGYHAYQDIWDPRIGEVLPLQREPGNPEDKFAVAVIRRGNIVGHLPFNLAPVVSAFLRRDVNKGLVEVKGAKVNRGAGLWARDSVHISFLWIKILYRQTEPTSGGSSRRRMFVETL